MYFLFQPQMIKFYVSSFERSPSGLEIHSPLRSVQLRELSVLEVSNFEMSTLEMCLPQAFIDCASKLGQSYSLKWSNVAQTKIAKVKKVLRRI